METAALQENTGKFGLTTFQLKLLALIFMTIDHLGAYGRSIPLLEEWYFVLRILGRISAPLFLYAVVQGAIHTRSKKRYLLRLYTLGVSIGVFDTVVYFCFGKKMGLPQFGNILLTFFFVILYILIAEHFFAALRAKNTKSLLLSMAAAAAALLPHLLFLLLPANLSDSMAYSLARGILASLLPRVLSVTYGFPFIVLGIVWYFARKKWPQCVVYVLFCLGCVLWTTIRQDVSWQVIHWLIPGSYNTLQCYMILALPFLLLYNGKKGRSCKWLFYGYYPLHRYLIAIAALLA